MPKNPTRLTRKSPTQRAALIVFFLMCSMISLGICAWLFQDQLRLPQLVASIRKPTPQPERYALLTEDLEIRKLRLRERYLNAQSNSERSLVLNESRALLEAVTPEMMRCWLGTSWDYNGHCETPGGGKIACGYFVTTVLRDAGFELNRFKLAQQPSQIILGAFVPREHMTIRTGMDFDPFWNSLLEQDPGIYIIGLDKHVGFLVHDGTAIHYLHSSGSAPWCVVSESRENAHSIQRSRYRVIGNLTAQDATLKKWLLGETLF